jgi:hypothetical protein
MTEAEWLTCDNPSRMLAVVARFGERKQRLFACACCRAIWALVDDDKARNAVEVAERFADGGARAGQLSAAYRKAARVTSAANKAALISAEASLTPSLTSAAIVCALDAVAMPAKDVAAAFAAENNRQLHLLHCIFGNPFRPVALDPEWRTSTVVQLAQGIYDDRAFDRLPILADALQDAGCDNEDVLSHCRDTGPHARGCWVVDLILGKS